MADLISTNLVRPTWLDPELTFEDAAGNDVPSRKIVQVIGPVGTLRDDPKNKATVIDPSRLLGPPQQTATSGDGSPHTVGSGVDLASSALTSIDAEVYATDGTNWGWWRLTQAYVRLGTGSPIASGAVLQPTGFPRGSNAGSPPTGWSSTIVLGTGLTAFTAFIQITGPATWYWFIDGARYPGDELALLITVGGVFPSSGDPSGGTTPPTFVSITPSFGGTGGGP